MAFISLRQLLDHAAENGYGVPAFNVNNMEQVQAIMQAAEATKSPVILQASAGARKYAGEPYLRHLVLAALEAHPDLPVVLHQDHGASPSVCQQAIRSGFTSVMMDGSLMPDQKTPAAYDYNVEVSRRVVEAGVRAFWREYVGLEGGVVGIDTFGESAPAADLFDHFQVTAQAVVDEARRVVLHAK